MFFICTEPIIVFIAAVRYGIYSYIACRNFVKSITVLPHEQISSKNT